MQQEGCQGGCLPDPARSGSGGRAERNKPEQSLAISASLNPTSFLPTKKQRHVQIRLYLPTDVVGRLKALTPPIRNAILAGRLRAMAWDCDLDPARLQGSLEQLREACILARQLIRKSKGKLVHPNAAENLLTLVQQIIRP